MITPGLTRRALSAGSQWRLLLLWLMGLALPAAAGLLPLSALLANALDRAPRAPQLAAALDAEALVDLVHVLAQPEAGLALLSGAKALALLALLIWPLLGGAAVAAARSADPLRWRALLRGAGEEYGLMLRLAAVSLIPLLAAALAAAPAFALAHLHATHARTEAAAEAGYLAAAALALGLAFAAHLTIDAARGVLAARPDRRSALFAWTHGLGVLLRRPLQALIFGALTLLAGLLPAAVLLLARLQIPQRTPAAVLLAFVISQLALAAIGWARASRVIGFAELVHADEADQRKPVAAAIAIVPTTVSLPAP